MDEPDVAAQKEPVLALTDPEDPEAMAAGLISKTYIQKLMQLSVVLDASLKAPEFSELIDNATTLMTVWFVTPGTLRSKHQLIRLGALRCSRDFSSVTLIVGSSFDFPVEAFYTELANGGPPFESADIGALIQKDFGDIDMNLGHIMEALRDAFSCIAVYVDIPNINDSLLAVHMNQLSQRLQSARKEQLQHTGPITGRLSKAMKSFWQMRTDSMMRPKPSSTNESSVSKTPTFAVGAEKPKDITPVLVTPVLVTPGEGMSSQGQAPDNFNPLVAPRDNDISSKSEVSEAVADPFWVVM